MLSVAHLSQPGRRLAELFLSLRVDELEPRVVGDRFDLSCVNFTDLIAIASRHLEVMVWYI